LRCTDCQVPRPAVPEATAIILTWLVWMEGITVPTGTWSVQMYISMA